MEREEEQIMALQEIILIEEIILIGIAGYILYKIITWLRTRQKRYIPFEVRQAVLRRYFGMCAVCPETLLLEFHHRKPYADNGDNSEKNIVPLCPKHHAMVTRMDNGK